MKLLYELNVGIFIFAQIQILVNGFDLRSGKKKKNKVQLFIHTKYGIRIFKDSSKSTKDSRIWSMGRAPLPKKEKIFQRQREREGDRVTNTKGD